MAVAVIDHEALVQLADDLGFPKYTKVKLCVGGTGHQYFDQFIRDNVKFVNQIDVDPAKHVRITESAQLVGEIPEHWGLRHQQYLEGTNESNAFQPIGADIDGDWVEVGSHVNRNAIRIAVGTAALKYKVEYDTDASGAISNINHLAVAIFDTPEDTSLSYTTELTVESIWTTKVEMLPNDDDAYVPQLFKRVYYHDPVKEESYPWIYVGRLTDEEYTIWREHNIKPVAEQNWANVDFLAITEPTPKDLLKAAGLKIAHLAS